MYDSTYDYSTTYSSSNLDPAAAGALGAFFMTYFLVILVVAVLAIIGMWKIFAKAGQPGWAAIIPIYNLYILTKVVGREWWWVILMLIPYLNVIIFLIISLDLAKSFGKSAAFGVVALWLFSIVGYLMLGFGQAKYVGPAAAKK